MLADFYKKQNYKVLMLIPLAILLASIGILVSNYFTHGEFLERGIDLRGGTVISFSVDQGSDVKGLEEFLKQRFGDVEVRQTAGVSGTGVLIETVETDSEEVRAAVSEFGLQTSDFSVQTIGPALGEAFWSQSQYAFLLAFVFMSLSVFLTFRELVPSLAVIQAGVADILGAAALMSIFGIPLSLASFAGLMLAIGYSVDTDILLTTRMLKRQGHPVDNGLMAAKTGLTMTAAALASLGAMLLLTTASALHDIAAVLIFALLIDIPSTWLMNMGVLRWWLERKGRI